MVQELFISSSQERSRYLNNQPLNLGNSRKTLIHQAILIRASACHIKCLEDIK